MLEKRLRKERRAARKLSALASFCYRRPGRVLLGLALATTLAATVLGRLRVDASLTQLLPQRFDSVRDVDRLRERFGGVGYVAVVASGAPPEVLERFADDVAPRLESLPSVRWVEQHKPTSFFRSQGLYYVDVADLEALHERLEARRSWEHAQRNPFFVSLEDEGPPSLDFSDLESKYAERLGTRLWEQGESRYYLDPQARQITILVKPRRLASDLDFTKQVVSDVRGVLRQARLDRYHEDLRAELSGRYTKKVELQRVIESDLTTTSLLALLLITAYVAVHFRRLSAVPLLLVPLFVGLCWTYAAAALFIGTLNILSGFVGAILLGLGIDNGIHILMRYQGERARDRYPEEALRAAFGDTGRAALTAMLTTLVALLALGMSEFRGFREFGLLAISGLVLVLLSYVTTLPALLGLAERLGVRPSVPLQHVGALSRRWRRWAPAVLWLVLLGVLGLGTRAGEVRFDYDFASLDPAGLRSYVLDRDVNRLLGRSQTPLVVPVEDEAAAKRVVEALEKRKQAHPEAGIDRIASTANLVPDHQQLKQRKLEKIGESVAAILPHVDDPAKRKDLERLREMAKADPFTEAELPESIRRRFEPLSEAGPAEFVLVYPGVSLSDGRAVRRLTAQLQEIPVGGGETVDAAGEAMVLADVLRQVLQETPRIVVAAFVMVLTVLWVLFGRLRSALFAALPAAATLLGTFGLMELLGVRLNYLNVIALPVLLGIGVDGGAHMVSRVSQRADWAPAVAETSRAIAGAVLTTAFGFGALWLARHPGLQSVAHVAVLGLGVNLVVSVLLLPALLWVWPLQSSDGERSRRPRWVTMAATVGGAGYAPSAPGSLGALPALLVAWALRDAHWWSWIPLLVGLTGLSVWLVHRYLKRGEGGRTDPQEVVLDEFVGCLIALAFVPWQLGWILAAYVLFRLLDMLKPWPIRTFERRVNGGWGVVGDDVLAGLLAGAMLAVVRGVLVKVGVA